MLTYGTPFLSKYMICGKFCFVEKRWKRERKNMTREQQNK